MGSLISAYQLIGSQEVREDTVVEKKDTEEKTTTDPSKAKSKSKQKTKNEEPTFSSDLSTPIEKVIEETITESRVEQQNIGVKKKVKSSKGRKEKLKNQQSETSEVKNITSTSNSTSKTAKIQNKTNSVQIVDSEEHSEVSFLPVREKNKKGKSQTKTEKCGDEALKTIVAKSVRKSKDSSDIIDHYKIKKSPKHQAVIEPLPVVTRRFSDTYEKVQNFVVVNRLEEKPSESEIVWKESKKVSSSISYASVVLNNYQNPEEKDNSYEIVNKEDILGGTVTYLDSSKSSPDSAEFVSTSECHETCQQNNSGNTDNTDSSKSSSESIETLDNSELQESLIKYKESADFCKESQEAVLNSFHSDSSKSSSESIEVLESFCDPDENLVNLESDQEPNDINLSASNTEVCTIDYKDDLDKVEQKIVDDLLGADSIIRNFKENSENTFSSSVLIQNVVNLEKKPLQSTKEIILQDQGSTTNFSSSVDNKHEVTKKSTESLKGSSEKESNMSYCSTLKRENSVKLNLEIMKQIRVLTLNDKEHQECTLYRLEKNWTLQFRIGPSLFGRKVFLYCNYPPNNTAFIRNKYYPVPWVLDEGCKNADDTAAFANVTVKIAGSFHFFFTFSEGSSTKEGSGYFLVDPVIKYGNNEDLPLDCIQCQTVLAKSLGSFSSWENKLKVAKESGYNMIHFTPIQELGESNSSYSLSEQLKINPVFKKNNSVMPTFEEIEAFTGKLRKEWKMCSICDIVLNHTANESLWIQEHPEVTYNCVNCPYMRPAYLLDAALHQFSMDVKNGLYEDKGIPAEVTTEEHLNAIRYHFRQSVLEPLNIPELYICDVNNIVREFLISARNSAPVTYNPIQVKKDELALQQDPEYRRLSATIDKNLALELYNTYRNDTFDEESRLRKCSEDLKAKLEELNKVVIDEVNGHLNAAIENVIAGIRYYWVQADGPKFKEITVKTPLVYRYFTDFGKPTSLKEFEEIMYSQNGRFLMAHNGWVMNSDPLKNFAASDSKVYIRRELIAWGDSVKLRYGDKPEDCPFLWEHMRKYVEQTAKIFDGVRLDNCHSTPIPVAEYLLDCARRVRPDLYVVAELFTNSDMTDNIFVNRLGITSLIREAMSAWDSHEEGRLVYRYGGYPVGSFYQPSIRPLVPSVAHALFLDLTHDNPSPVEKRSVFDLLPSTALVNMASCASGSNRGYDELVPHHIHVVDETREYTEWSDEKLAVDNVKFVSHNSGLISAKRAINHLHFALGKEGYNQVYVDQMDADIVAVTRHCPNSHQSYILISFTAFGHPAEDAGNYQRGIKPLRFEGVLDEIVLEASLSHVGFKSGGSKFKKFKEFVKDSKCINGLSDYEVSLKQHIQVEESDVFEKVESGSFNVTQLNFKNFKPGSIVVVKTSLPVQMKKAVDSVRQLINEFSKIGNSELYEIVSKMSLADLNRAIFRCDKEERDEGYGFDTYNIPNFGFMVYAGLQGMISLLANIRPNNDLGHPLCANLRDGNWMIDYVWRRLQFDAGTKDLGDWIEKNSNSLKDIPRYLIPCYFDVIVTGIYIQLVEQSYELMSSFVKNGSTFVRGLSLGSVQMAAYIKTADLPTLSPNLAPPKPPFRTNDNGEEFQACVTLSAGLPHFSTGYMRNWGRDTFIALRGLFIITGRYQEAREHILGYGACLRHGLIPNLLDGGRNPRFNCRDAVWWWLHCIKEYVEESPNGVSILSDKVSRIFPKDDSPNQPAGSVDQPLHDVMQEALNVHFQGLVFRERNAGRQIDEHMTDHGFNNQIGIHPETGFVFGGNQWNCGTWMDKMGSSDKAGNRGKPATPRDGSAVELIGLSKAVVTWLDKMYNQKRYPYPGVERTHKNGSVTKWSFKEWSDKIQVNFEKYFWVNSTPVDGEIRPDLINKRAIYKDSHGSSQDFPDFQLRCNFPIAMAVAPELFTPEHAWKALYQAEKYLLGPLGMKTLDPQDWAYRGDYDNSNDSSDPSVANGFNYHQGPEWVWPVGFFLRAKLLFAAQNGALKETLANTKLILSKHFVELQTSVWRGLPELTNSSGAYCKDSSRTQAWSMSCILEVLYDLQRMESQLQLVN